MLVACGICYYRCVHVNMQQLCNQWEQVTQLWGSLARSSIISFDLSLSADNGGKVLVY